MKFSDNDLIAVKILKTFGNYYGKKRPELADLFLLTPL